MKTAVSVQFYLNSICHFEKKKFLERKRFFSNLLFIINKLVLTVISDKTGCTREICPFLKRKHTFILVTSLSSLHTCIFHNKMHPSLFSSNCSSCGSWVASQHGKANMTFKPQKFLDIFTAWTEFLNQRHSHEATLSVRQQKDTSSLPIPQTCGRHVAGNLDFTDVSQFFSIVFSGEEVVTFFYTRLNE